MRLRGLAMAGLSWAACTAGEAPSTPSSPNESAGIAPTADPVPPSPLPEPVLGPVPPPEGAVVLEAKIAHSVEASLNRVAGPDWGKAASQVAKRVLVWWIDPRRDLRRGDQIALALTFHQEGAEPTLHALWFESQKWGRSFAAYLHRREGDEFARFYDRDGVEVESRLVNGPIESYEQVTSLLGDGRGHKGVDFKGPVGTPIKAPFDGRVVRRNWSTRTNGRCVELEGPNGVHAVFLHLSKVEVAAGQWLKRGQRIGLLGNTGRSTAPHLHYQLGRNGRVLDPFEFHRTERRQLSEPDLPAFDETVRRWESLRGGV